MESTRCHVFTRDQKETQRLALERVFMFSCYRWKREGYSVGCNFQLHCKTAKSCTLTL